MPVSVITGRIHPLPAILASQIAAGEVIERPASVAKELLENCLDAGATRIQIDIEAAGRRLIRVRDNGAGIHADDLVLALAPHSTSKIRHVEDLAAIHSLGFRGEALASIAACARLRIGSCQPQATAREIVVEPGRPPAAPAPVAHPAGTTIEVRDLFFNMPARLKFLRSEQTEFLHILELVKSYSLARPGLGLKLSHNGRVVFSITAAAGLLDRVATIFGGAFADHACAVDVSNHGLRLSGIAGNPATARSQADRQYLFLNGRLIRDRRLYHALRLAYSEELATGRYAPVLLYLEMDAADYDVNVHPTKHEVRFRAARDVHDFVYSALRRSLEAGQPPHGQPAINEREINEQRPKNFRATDQAPLAEPPSPRYAKTVRAPVIFGDYLTHIDGYLLSRSAKGMVVTDIRRAVEQLTILELRQAYQNDTLSERPLLLPQSMRISLSQQTLVEDWQLRLESLAIRLDLTGPAEVALRTLPKQLPAVSASLLPQLLACLKQCSTQVNDWPIAIIDTLAEHAAVEFEQVLAAQSAQQLLQRLETAVAAGRLPSPWPWRELDAAALAAWLRQT